MTQTHDDIPFAVNHVSPTHFCRQLLCAGASSTGGTAFKSTGRVKHASGASAQALEYGCLRFVPATKTRDDIPFAVNCVSPTHFCRRLLCAGVSSTVGVASVSLCLEDVRKGREKAPTYSTSFIEIPNEFHSFKWPPVASKNVRRRSSDGVTVLGEWLLFVGWLAFSWGFV